MTINVQSLKRHGYNFSEGKAAEIHGKAKTLFPLVPKTDVARLMVKEAVIEESLKQNKMTADETRELLFKVLREKYGDYVRQTLATEQRIRQIAASMVHKGIIKCVSDPALQFALKMSPAGIRKNFEKSLNECRKFTPDNIEKLTEEELAQVYVAIATNGKMPYDDERKIIEQKAQEYLHYLPSFPQSGSGV